MSKLETKRFVIRKSLIGKNTIITFVNKKQEKVSYNHDEWVHCSNGFCEFDSHATTKCLTKNIKLWLEMS